MYEYVHVYIYISCYYDYNVIKDIYTYIYVQGEEANKEKKTLNH